MAEASTPHADSAAPALNSHIANDAYFDGLCRTQKLSPGNSKVAATTAQQDRAQMAPFAIIQGGPNGDIDPPGEVHFLFARHSQDGRIEWNDAGGRLHHETHEISEVALAEAVIASIELINPA